MQGAHAWTSFDKHCVPVHAGSAMSSATRAQWSRNHVVLMCAGRQHLFHQQHHYRRDLRSTSCAAVHRDVACKVKLCLVLTRTAPYVKLSQPVTLQLHPVNHHQQPIKSTTNAAAGYERSPSSVSVAVATAAHHCCCCCCCTILVLKTACSSAAPLHGKFLRGGQS